MCLFICVDIKNLQKVLTTMQVHYMMAKMPQVQVAVVQDRHGHELEQDASYSNQMQVAQVLKVRE